MISFEDGKLFRGDTEIYPIAGDQYYTPASGTILAFRRDASNEVDAILIPGDDDEIVLPRIAGSSSK